MGKDKQAFLHSFQDVSFQLYNAYICRNNYTMPSSFEEFKISPSLVKALKREGIENPTPIQEESYPVISSGRDVVGISQTGTGKTIAFMLPLLNWIPKSNETHPRILVLAPTRELVVQLVEETEKLCAWLSLKIIGVYGGTNMNPQKAALEGGADIVIATPGRLYDLLLCQALKPKNIKKLVIDEVDVMLDLGFRPQLQNIMDLLPEKRQNVLFSATMTDEVKELMTDFFKSPIEITTAVSGTPLENIEQSAIEVPNFFTKVNYLFELLAERNEFKKVLIFVNQKKLADKVYHLLSLDFSEEVEVIHANKTQNYRLQAIEAFEQNEKRILITTDVMARGIDLTEITHVINLDVPKYPENYLHRIGRTGRAGNKGKSLLLYTSFEYDRKDAIERLMGKEIPKQIFPTHIEVSTELISEELPQDMEIYRPLKEESGPSFHEKKEKNKKVNLGGSYHRWIKEKYKKPKSKGDKIQNRKRK